MTRSEVDKLFKNICYNNNIELRDIETDPYDWDSRDIKFRYRNASTCTYKSIELGLYEDEELRIVSFFHELGHIKDKEKYTSRYLREKGAWKVGFKLAKKYGFKFSKKTKDWCHKQLSSYRDK